MNAIIKLTIIKCKKFSCVETHKRATSVPLGGKRSYKILKKLKQFLLKYKKFYLNKIYLKN